MKKIAVLSPDTVKLPLCTHTSEEVLDKCSRSTGLGIRSQNIATELSKKFDVTLFLPSLNLPENPSIINKNSLPYKIESYDFYSSLDTSPQELTTKLTSFNFVIIQSATGAGFHSAVALPRHICVVMDGFVPLLSEYHYTLTNMAIKESYMYQMYLKLLQRSNVILYANSHQKLMYEAQLEMLRYINASNYAGEEKVLVYTPYGVEDNIEICGNTICNKFLWYGSIYPWYNFEKTISFFQNHREYSLNLLGIEHPRYKRSSTDLLKKVDLQKTHNIKQIAGYLDNNRSEVFKSHSAALLLAKPSSENTFSNRIRVLELISCGIPVLITKGSAIPKDYPFLESSNYVIEVEEGILTKEVIEHSIQKITSGNKAIKEQLLLEFKRTLRWENCTQSLITTIQEL